MAARGAPSGGAHRFEVDDDAEETVVLNRGRKKAKGLGPVTWLALITFGIIAVSLMDAHRRAVRPAPLALWHWGYRCARRSCGRGRFC